MTNISALIEQISSSELSPPIKVGLTDLFRQVESLAPLLSIHNQSRVGHQLERLVREVLDPGMETILWEVALGLIAKVARSQGEHGGQVLEAIETLVPALQTHFGPEGEVTLREITEDTVYGVILLTDTLSEPKRNFVAPNAVSLSQALFSKHAWYRAIYAGKALVGFLMLYDDPEEPTYFLWRFMIAEPFHGRGFARQAIQRLIEHVRTRPGAKKLLLSCGEGEGSPEGFYAKQGFTRTGAVEGDEVVMGIDL